MISVLTPFRGAQEDDVSYLEAAPRAIAPRLHEGNLVILESRSPVGATEKAAGWLADARQDLTFPHTHGKASDTRIGHCPERVLPSHIHWGLYQNAHVICGMPRKYSKTVPALYGIFVAGECIVIDRRTAEMSKLTENHFRDVNIAPRNELSMLCEKLYLDVCELIKLSHRHPRVTILTPGPGVGGHSIAVDPWFIVSSAPEQATLVRNARKMNSLTLESAMEQLHRKIDPAIEVKGLSSDKNLRIAFYSIAFKSNIDDLHERPSLQIVEKMAKRFGGEAQMVEPNIDQLRFSVDTRNLRTPVEVEADIRVFLVKHPQLVDIAYNFESDPDLCGLCDPKAQRDLDRF